MGTTTALAAFGQSVAPVANAIREKANSLKPASTGNPVVTTTNNVAITVIPATGADLSAVGKWDSHHPSRIHKLVIAGQSTDSPDKKITKLIYTEINVLEERAKKDDEGFEWPSVRADLLELTQISTQRYCLVKKRVFDVLIQVLETDPIKQETEPGVLEVIENLYQQVLKLDAAQRLSVDFQKICLKAFSAAVELYLRHYEARFANGVLGTLKDTLIRAEKEVRTLNTQKDPTIEFALQMSLEATKRLIGNISEFSEAMTRLAKLFSSADDFFNGRFSECLENLFKAVDGLQDKIRSSWYDTLYVMRGLVRKETDVARKVDLIILMLTRAEVQKAKVDWKFIYGALQLLEDTIARAATEIDPTILKAALLGRSQLLNEERTQLVGVRHFIKFIGYKKKALVASEDDKRADDAIQSKAKEVGTFLVEKMLKSFEGRTALAYPYRDACNQTKKKVNTEDLGLIELLDGRIDKKVIAMDDRIKKWAQQVPLFAEARRPKVVPKIPKVPEPIVVHEPNENKEDKEPPDSACNGCFSAVIEKVSALCGKRSEYESITGDEDLRTSA